MARDQAQVLCPPDVWTELTNGDVTELTFQVTSGSIKVRFTTGAAPAALSDAGYEYHANATEYQRDGELRAAVTDFASVAGADRAFVTPLNGRRAVVVVDHA
jgi:hypothetical protein